MTEDFITDAPDEIWVDFEDNEIYDASKYEPDVLMEKTCRKYRAFDTTNRLNTPIPESRKALEALDDMESWWLKGEGKNNMRDNFKAVRAHLTHPAPKDTLEALLERVPSPAWQLTYNGGAVLGQYQFLLGDMRHGSGKTPAEALQAALRKEGE